MSTQSSTMNVICNSERVRINEATAKLVEKLEQINNKRGLLLDEVTKVLEVRSADKLRSTINKTFIHGA